MPRGFLARGWYDAIKTTGAKHPERRMDSLQRLVWTEVVNPLWETRNELMHRNENRHREAEEVMLTEKIRWYVSHRHEVLSYRDGFLADVDMSSLHRMRRDTKREWLRHLEAARQAHAVESQLRASGQNAITRYLVPRTTGDGDD